MTDKDVIEAIRKCHLRANIRNTAYVRHHWALARVDAGGTVFGRGPYVHLPVDWLMEHGGTKTERVVIRVYPPERLRKRLAAQWSPDALVTFAGLCSHGAAR